MSNLVIEVVNVSINTVPTAKGSYQVADVAYKNKTFQDKLEGKKVMSFSNKGVFETLSKASFGDVFEVTRVKNDKGFWDWTALSTGGSSDTQGTSDSGSMANNNSTPSVKGTVTPKSNYETAEERAARQVLIVRQSSISSAVALLAINKKAANIDETILIAKAFEDYVFGNNTNRYEAEVKPEAPEGNFFEGMDDDLP